MNRLLLAGAALLAAVILPNAGHAQGTVKVGVILPFSGQFADGARQVDEGIKLYMKRHGDTVAGKKIEIIRKDVGGIAPPVAKRLAEEALGAAKNGVKKAYTMVSDYAPGHDAEQGFINGFKAAGGEIIGSVRMAVANPDFSAYVQRAKDLNPEAIFVFIPGGAQPAAVGKAFAERGIDTKKTKVFGTGELTDDSALKNMGDSALGIITAWPYDHNLKTKLNQDFVTQYKKEFNGDNPNFFSAGGYDGMTLIYEALKKTKGDASADKLMAAIKTTKWVSPRGPMAIDPETRDVMENIYIRRVEKVGGKLVNVDFAKVENVKDPVQEAMYKRKR